MPADRTAYAHAQSRLLLALLRGPPREGGRRDGLQFARAMARRVRLGDAARREITEQARVLLALTAAVRRNAAAIPAPRLRRRPPGAGRGAYHYRAVARVRPVIPAGAGHGRGPRPRRPCATVLALVLAAVAGAGGCGGANDDPLPARDVTIASGNEGGVYFEYGRGIAEVIAAHLPRLRPRAVETSGSVDNLRRLRGERAQVAFTRADSALQELGADPPTSRRQVVALAKLYDSYVQVVVLASSDIHRLADLRNRCDGRCRIAVGPRGSGTRLISQRLLQKAGLPEGDAIRQDRRLDIGEAIRALGTRRVDAVVWAGGLPTPAIQDLVEGGTDVRLVDLGAVAAQLREAHPNVYSPTRVPGSVYLSATATEVPESVGTVSVANYLAVRADLPDEVAYRLTALIFEHRRDLAEAHDEARYLDRRTATDVYPLKLHPGAARYYREAAG